MTRVAIVIVSFNARAALERCLQALALHPPASSHEIVVVDNASTDGSVAAVRARWPGVRLIEASDNLGFARACNLGIRATESEYVLLLNSDTVVPAGAVDALVALLESRPDVAIVGPRLVDESGRPELSFGRTLGPCAEAWQKFLGRAYARGQGWAVRWVRHRSRREQTPDWVSGACLLVRRADAEAVGLLDERFSLYLEDVDFCAAVRARGRKVVFSPCAEVVHRRGASRQAAPEAAERAYRASQLAFYQKHHPQWLPLLRAYLRWRGKLPAPTRSAPNRTA